MNVNKIRKFAKEIRTGKCELGYFDAASLYNEMLGYVNSEVAENWTERTKGFVNADMEVIKEYVNIPLVKEEEPVNDAEPEPAEYIETEEPEPEKIDLDDDSQTYYLDLEAAKITVNPADKPEEKENPVRRRAFKTIVKMMEGKKDPILEAVRWCGVVYRKDGQDKYKCIKGMIERRGYKTEENENGLTVLNNEGTEPIAFVENRDGYVGEFSITL